MAASSSSGITGAQLIPAPADYVVYDLTWEPLDLIKVECLPNPVERGQQVTCTASPEQQGATLTVSEWRFEAAELSGAVIEQSASTTWSGTAATAGTVTCKVRSTASLGAETVLSLSQPGSGPPQMATQ